MSDRLVLGGGLLVVEDMPRRVSAVFRSSTMTSGEVESEDIGVESILS